MREEIRGISMESRNNERFLIGDRRCGVDIPCQCGILHDHPLSGRAQAGRPASPAASPDLSQPHNPVAHLRENILRVAHRHQAYISSPGFSQQKSPDLPLGY